jgi:hypothetical protein
MTLRTRLEQRYPLCGRPRPALSRGQRGSRRTDKPDAAAILRAKRTAITAAEVFEMQNKDPRSAPSRWLVLRRLKSAVSGSS